MNKALKSKAVEAATYADGRMNSKGAAAYLWLGEKTLAMMRCEGRGPRFLKRGRIFYFKEDLDAWIAAPGRVTSTAQARQMLGAA